jgi:hypothetical protein
MHKAEIITSYWPKPIPTDRFDWEAYRDPEGKVGHGSTEKDAIGDLLEMEEFDA